MTKIDKTAIITPSAKIDEDVCIGPYSVIDGGVSIGSGTIIDAHVRISGQTIIGKNNQIYFSCFLGGPPQHLNYDPKKDGNYSRLYIGDHNTFREFSQVHCSMQPDTATKIGDYNYLMSNTHVGHDVQIGNHNIIVQGSGISGHSVIGNHVNISGFVGIHQWLRVGSYAMIGSAAIVHKDIPPYALAKGGEGAQVYGINRVGLRRAGFSAEERSLIKKIYRIFYLEERSQRRGLERLRSEILQTRIKENQPIDIIKEFVDFIATSKHKGVATFHLTSKRYVTNHVGNQTDD